ncbi:DUF6075 family protein [Paenibacillus agaridevorans]|uniref:DUF6075 family protein n=1 Tax=Paenibacillus agaridevorans TaxID=171404 RepID=UPI001BE3FB8B|nr:DUF6075 family protein [Paenibacillus agaridevorans]
MQPKMFRDEEHERFYYESLRKSNCTDAYHRAVFYALGISWETRSHANELFDYSNDSIRPKGLTAAWQTSSTIRVSRLAFNLWNGWTEDGKDSYSTPHELFDCSYAPFFFEAIRLRYPEYCRSHERANKRTGEHIR